MVDGFYLGTNIVECFINAFNKAGDGKVERLKPDAGAVERSIVDTLNRNNGSLNGQELYDIVCSKPIKSALWIAGMEPEDIIIYILRIRSLNMEFEDLKKKLKKSFKREPLYIEANGLDDKKEAVNKLLDLKELKKFSTDTEWIDGEIKKGDNYFEDMYPSLHSLVDLPLVVNYKPNNEILNNKVYKCFEKFLIDKGLLTPPNDEADESLDKDVERELEPASSMGAESAGPDGSSDPSASVELHDISPAVSSVSSVRPSDSGIDNKSILESYINVYEIYISNLHNKVSDVSRIKKTLDIARDVLVQKINEVEILKLEQEVVLKYYTAVISKLEQELVLKDYTEVISKLESELNELKQNSVSKEYLSDILNNIKYDIMIRLNDEIDIPTGGIRINVDGRVGKITGFEKKPVGKNVYTIYFDDGTLENLKLNDHVWKILQQTVGSEGGFRRSKPRQNKTKRIANCKTKRKMKRKTKLNKRKTIRKTKLNKRKTKRKKKTRL